MPDYKEMYLKLFRANEQAINTLVGALSMRDSGIYGGTEKQHHEIDHVTVINVYMVFSGRLLPKCSQC